VAQNDRTLRGLHCHRVLKMLPVSSRRFDSPLRLTRSQYLVCVVHPAAAPQRQTRAHTSAHTAQRRSVALTCPPHALEAASANSSNMVSSVRMRTALHCGDGGAHPRSALAGAECSDECRLASTRQEHPARHVDIQPSPHVPPGVTRRCTGPPWLSAGNPATRSHHGNMIDRAIRHLLTLQ
jgi:hypothetical protein